MELYFAEISSLCTCTYHSGRVTNPFSSLFINQKQEKDILHSDFCRWLAGLYCMQASTVTVSQRACNRCSTLYKTSTQHGLAGVANSMSSGICQEVVVGMCTVIFSCS